MRMGLAFSKKLVALCTASICAAVSSLLIRSRLAHDGTASLRTASGSAEELSREIASLSNFSDSDVVALRSRVKIFQSLLGPEDTWHELKEKFGGPWSIESGVRHESNGAVNQTGILTINSPTLSDWQTAVDALGTLGTLPGITVVRFEMKTSGNLEHRSVDIIKIVIQINARRAPLSTMTQ